MNDVLAILGRIIAEFWEVLVEMSPYLLFGFLVAGILATLVPASVVERHLGGRGLWPITKASMFGVPLPLCSCGVIPVSASLRRHGASRGATASFLLSTPQTGVDSIMVTLSLLGPVYAIFRPVAAFVTGVVGGLAVSLFEPDGGPDDAAAPACQDACCSAEGAKRSKLVRVFEYGFLTLPRDIGRSLLLGLVLAGIIAVAVPRDLAATYGTGLLGMAVMMAVGIPIYVCATASVPIAAALIYKGVSPGAALVFLMTGPATNAAAFATIWKVLGRRTALVYLGSVVVSAFGFGTLLNFIYSHAAVARPAELHELIPYPVAVGAAVVLLGVLAVAILKKPHRVTDVESEGISMAAKEEIRLTVKGMTCAHCVANVARALRESPGVASADVDLKSGEAVVRGQGLDAQALCDAVDDLGYEAAVKAS